MNRSLYEKKIFAKNHFEKFNVVCLCAMARLRKSPLTAFRISTNIHDIEMITLCIISLFIVIVLIDIIINKLWE